MSITIHPVRTKRDLMRFIKMVWPIYNGDPNWVPPVIADRKKLLDVVKNPFYHHSSMEMFLAVRGDGGGEVVGRIAAIVNDNHNLVHHDKVGFFGFFESTNDQDVSNLLFKSAEEFLRNKGMTEIRGPLNPSINDEAGLLIDGFGDPPQILMTYNPPYYIDLIESYGFSKIRDMYAFQLQGASFISPKLERVQTRVRERMGVSIRNVDFGNKTNFKRDVGILKEIYNAAWEDNWGAVRMTDAEFDFLAADLKQIAVPDLAIIAEKDGKPIGFALGLPDINQVLINNRRGGLLGAAWQLLFNKKRINRGRILVLGVLPELRGRGLDGVLYYEIGNRMVSHGYAEGEASWILEDNTMMIRAAEMMSGKRYKTYRIYEKTMNKN